jgi:HK97 gp10 family phage protein
MSVDIDVDTSSAEAYLEENEEENMTAIDNLVKYLANNICDEAKRLCPVRTGRLRDSIRVEEISDKICDVVAGGIEVSGKFVNYAVFVEYGTRYFVGRFYMHSALETIKAKFKSLVEQVKTMVIPEFK